MERKGNYDKQITFGSKKTLIGFLGLAVIAVILLTIIRVFFL